MARQVALSINLKSAFSGKWSDGKYSLGKPPYAVIIDSGNVSNAEVTFKFTESNQM